MNTSARPFLVVVCSGVLAAGITAFGRQTAPPLPPLVLPAGFQADVFAENVENARSMVLGPQGTVFVGSRTAGKLHAVIDRDGDHKADRVDRNIAAKCTPWWIPTATTRPIVSS